jgi:hypothetical protein
MANAIIGKVFPVFVSCVTFLSLNGCASTQRPGSAITAAETSYLIVRDRTGQLTDEQVRKLADKADNALREVLKFWSEDPKIDELGKIRLELERPLGQGKYYGAVFKSELEGSNKRRIVYVFGVDKEPQMMVHKLTHAIFFHKDKLIRNMMGIPMEVLFANRLSFPMCGFNNAAWVLAFRQLKLNIPLTDLGPEHESWGMTMEGKFPTLTSRTTQHIAYAETGSFGFYLLDTYGVEKVKNFYRLSLQKKRPWKEIFGMTLRDLETNWVRSLESIQQKEEGVSELRRIFRIRPDQACFDAQDLAIKTRKGK